MPSLFSGLENKLSDAVDATFGEQFQFQPMVPGASGGRPSADESRATRQVIGVFDDRSFSSKSFGDVARTAMQVTLRHQWLSIDKRQFLDGQMPRQKDSFKRLDTGTTYSVAEVTQDGEGRYKLRLVDGVQS